MESKNGTFQAIEGLDIHKKERRASFLSTKALRSLSISSQVSSSSETEGSSSPPGHRRRTLLRKSRVSASLKADLGRRPSKSSAEDDGTSTSTRPTSPSGTGSRGTSISGDHMNIVKFGALQAETSILKAKKEHYLVLTPSALFKFKNRAAALEQFPQAATPHSAAGGWSPVGSVGSYKDLKSLTTYAEAHIPLERIVSVFNDEGARPCFAIELWWKDPRETTAFSRLELDFSLPEDRDDWLKQIRHAIRLRCKSIPDERAPPDVESVFKQIVEARQRQKGSQLDIYPVIPRRPYTRPRSNSSEIKKHWREGSSFYLAFSKNFCFLGQFYKSGTGHRSNQNLVQFGLATLSRANASLNDERFDLIFRLPMDRPERLDLSSRHHRTILAKLFKADMYLKPAWPLWTRREVFFIDGESQPIYLPEGEDYGGFKRTLEAFLEAYRCADVNWTVNWEDVRYQPEFRLLPPTKQSQYSAYQLLAVFRALRYNDFFKSLSFRDIDFFNLSWASDNSKRMESTTWISRTGKRSLTRAEFEVVESSSVLFQEIVALLLGSESVKHLDLRNVLKNPQAPPIRVDESPHAPSKRICEVVPPIVLLWKSLQSRCNSVDVSGNPLGSTDVSGISRILQNRPGFVKALSLSHCQIDEHGLELLCEGLQEQRSSLEVLDLSHNTGRIDATDLSETLNGASKLRQLNLAYSIKGSLDGPLFRPWNSSLSFEPWRLEQLDLSGWKMNFDTLASILKYLELDESRNMRRLVLSNCGLSGDMATALLCRLGGGRDISLLINENPLETGSMDWIDLIEGNEAPRVLHLDMIQFQHQHNFHRLITALTHNKTIEFLSMVGTGPPTGANTEMSEMLFDFFKLNDTLKFLDLSGYSGKLEESQMGWSLSGALSGLMQNRSLLQLRIRNHDLGAAEDVTELCRVLAINEGLCMIDCQNNNFNHTQFANLVNALSNNQRLISFPWSDADRDYALQAERRRFMKTLSQPGKPVPVTLSKSAESRLAGTLKLLKANWEAEARKIEGIIRRNRDNVANHLIEFESEYIEAWDDKSLRTWLAPRPKIPGNAEERNRLSIASLDTHSLAPSPNLTIPAINLNLNLNLDMNLDMNMNSGAPYSASDPALGTYTIEEETSASASASASVSDRTSLYMIKPPPPTAAALQDSNSGSTPSLASSTVKVCPPVVDTLTLESW